MRGSRIPSEDSGSTGAGAEAATHARNAKLRIFNPAFHGALQDLRDVAQRIEAEQQGIFLVVTPPMPRLGSDERKVTVDLLQDGERAASLAMTVNLEGVLTVAGDRSATVNILDAATRREHFEAILREFVRANTR